MSRLASASVPRAGMLATVRNRRGVVAAVEPFEGEDGTVHLVHVEYKDAQSPPDERLLWELEPKCDLLEPNAAQGAREYSWNYLRSKRYGCTTEH